LHASDVTFDFSDGNIKTIHQHHAEPWRVTLVDTGLHTQTGGRLLRAREFLGDEPFLLTYGDGVSDIDIGQLLEFHRRHGKTATVTAAQPRARFGALQLDADGRVTSFKEKPRGDQAWVSAGFFVLEPDVFSYLRDDSTIFEQEPLEQLSARGELFAYRHAGFWQPMDTLRDKNFLEECWRQGRAEWKVWP
jgi:glucose-1-phosphate cytidylyltransferase